MREDFPIIKSLMALVRGPSSTNVIVILQKMYCKHQQFRDDQTHEMGLLLQDIKMGLHFAITVTEAARREVKSSYHFSSTFFQSNYIPNL